MEIVILGFAVIGFLTVAFVFAFAITLWYANDKRGLDGWSFKDAYELDPEKDRELINKYQPTIKK